MPATVHQIANDNLETHIADAVRRINAVTRVAGELYDERGEDGRHRDLETFEALFISAVNALNRQYPKDRAAAEKEWGHDSEAFKAISNLSLRQQADDMEGVLRAYDNERRRFLGDYDDSLDAELESVAVQMAAG